MLDKVKAFLEKKLPFLFDDDLYFKVRVTTCTSR